MKSLMSDSSIFRGLAIFSFHAAWLTFNHLTNNGDTEKKFAYNCP
jgi:hypothetical protein